MKEMISEQIQIITPYLLASLGLVLILLIAFVLLLTIKRFKRKPIIKRLPYLVFLSVFIVIGILSVTPQVGFTLNLCRDKNELAILEKEGIIDDISLYKLPIIEVENMRFTLSPRIGKAKVGDYCKFKYFKYSKYIYSIEIINDG